MTNPPTVVQANGSVTIHPSPDSVVCVVGQDGVVTSVLARPGELTVNMEREGREIWRHTFTYSFPPVIDAPDPSDPPSNGHHSSPVILDSEPTPRHRGRPKTRQPGLQPMTLDESN